MFTPDDPESKGARRPAARPAELQIVSDEDDPLPTREVGRPACGRGERGIVMAGYYKMPEATVRDTRDLWLHGRSRLAGRGRLPLFRRPQEGGHPPPRREHLRLRGRDADRQAPSVLESRRAGGFRAQRGRGDGLRRLPRRYRISEEELVRFANQNMAHFMVPRFVHFIEALPKTPSEKIEKDKLKGWAEENRQSIWDREAVGLKLER
jgi:crotonobetaine/carnitine-CoA ligase